MLSIDYTFACDHKCVPQVVQIWLEESVIPSCYLTSQVLQKWRHRKTMLVISAFDGEPIERKHHDHAFQSKYLEKVLFKL